MMKPWMILTALVAGTPAIAQQSFAAPEGCEALLTVQYKGCVMTNVWRCEADNPGDQWIALLTQAGVFSVQKVDAEFQWVEAYKVTGNQRLITPAEDPASLTELFDTQIDTWDFTLETDEGTERNVGYDQLTGETTEIDGEVLLNTEFQGRTIDGEGNEIDASSGRQFVSEKHRLFFFGQSWPQDDPEQIIDMSPVEFIYPDEPGFFADMPKYECNEIDAGYRP
ncbi:MAG: hypothetical protein AAFN63_12695 [Pseudomonadota bacterium]